MWLNFCRIEYIPRTAKKKLIITNQTSPLEKNINCITAEALNIENNILFIDNLKDEMKYHWVDYDTLSIRQIKLPFSSLENVDDEFKWTFQAIKCRINEISSIVFSYTDQKKMWKEPFFLY